MVDLSRETDRLLEEGRALVRDNREGGRHRRARAPSIGRGSAELKQQHFFGKLKRIVYTTGAILAGAFVAGLIIDGIGITGILVTGLAIAAAVFTLGAFPRLKIPKRADLNRGDVRTLVGRTELWLENQRPALPPPAVQIVDQLGVQLDALGLQLENVDAGHPQAQEIRRLVGETLPEMVDSYRRIPAHLRREGSEGNTPDAQITESLGKISKEIDGITRQLAQGSIDDLAIRTRYLDYKYGEGEVARQLSDGRD